MAFALRVFALAELVAEAFKASGSGFSGFGAQDFEFGVSGLNRGVRVRVGG